MITYADPFKAYVAVTPTAGVSEAYADSFNFLRACLMTSSVWFNGGVPTDEPDLGYIRYTLNRTDWDWFPGFNVSYTSKDYTPLLVDIENWYAFTSQEVTEAEAFASFDKVRSVLEVVREVFPNRKIAYYGWTPHNDWYGIKNWQSVQGQPDAANYATYLSVYANWKRDNERVRRGGSATAKNNRGPLVNADICTPDLYLPNNTTYDGSTSYTAHADCIQWASFFRECTAECKRVWQKPCIPYIQPYKPNTSTYLGDAFFTHMMDVAYADGNCDGFIVYYPSAAGTSDIEQPVSDWVTANLL